MGASPRRLSQLLLPLQTSFFSFFLVSCFFFSTAAGVAGELKLRKLAARCLVYVFISLVGDVGAPAAVAVTVAVANDVCLFVAAFFFRLLLLPLLLRGNRNNAIISLAV